MGTREKIEKAGKEFGETLLRGDFKPRRFPYGKYFSINDCPSIHLKIQNVNVWILPKIESAVSGFFLKDGENIMLLTPFSYQKGNYSSFFVKWNRMKNDILADLKNTFMHEWTHHEDAIRMKKSLKVFKPESREYFNSTHELNAYFYDAVRSIGKPSDGENWTQYLKKFLKFFKTFKVSRTSPYGNPVVWNLIEEKNKRRLISRLHKYYADQL